MTEVLSKQNARFEEFFRDHADDSPLQVTKQDLGRLRKRVMLSGGIHPGWPQAVGPAACGLMFLAVGYYFGQKK